MQRLVLIDGHAIVHRAYHALPPLTSSSGQLVNAVYGFVSMLLRVVDELKPTYLAVCFDLPVPTFRHEAYIAYQAKRPVMDEELSGQIQLVHEVVEAAGIPIYTAAGFEADDVIGTLARQARRLQTTDYRLRYKHKKAVDRRLWTVDEVVIVTGDRDMLQLVSSPTSLKELRGASKVKVYMTIRGLTEAKMFGEKDVEEYIGIKPSQIVDYKALVGDSSDNYPGVPGIGPQTALALLNKFGTLKKIYKAIKLKTQMSNVKTTTQMSKLPEIPESLGQKLVDGYEAAMLSQKLAKIRTDAPVELDLEKAKMGDLRGNEGFISKLKELRFKSLVSRLDIDTDKDIEKGKAQKKHNGQMGLI